MDIKVPSLSQKKAFLFDYGDTLVKYYKGSEFLPILKNALLSMSNHLKKHDYPIDSFEIIWDRAINENYELKDFQVRPLSARLQNIFQLDCHDLDPMDKLQEIFMLEIHKVGELYEDSIPSLKRLKKLLDVKIIVVSNTPWGTPSRLWQDELKRYSLDSSQDYIDFTLFCVDVGWRKPAPPIFHHILENQNLQARECIFIGDNLLWDVEGPKSVGIDAILLDRKNVHSKIPLPRITTLYHLFEHI